MIETYKDAARLPYPFCPGCSHSLVLDRLDAALVRLGRPPERIAIVTDIGCIGMSDQYFKTHAFHGLHGRVITYAAGIKLADPDLTVVAIQGDGGMGIGGHHMLNAAKRNVGVTALVCNNFNFGMTGGQHSVTTPQGGVTSTTRWGNIERPLDLAVTAAANGAAFVARATAFDADLEDMLFEALRTNGFSLLDVWELCPAYYMPQNALTKSGLVEMMQRLNFKRGVVHREERPDFSTAYREKFKSVAGTPALSGAPFEATHGHNLGARRFEVCIAGSAGQKIKSSASTFGRAAVMSGLWATQQDDYPVTVQSGHSTSQLIFATERIDYMGITKPDVVIVLSADGLSKVRQYLKIIDEGDSVFIMPDLLPVETRARVQTFDPEFLRLKVGRQYAAIASIAECLRRSSIFPLAALEDSIRLQKKAEYVERNLKAVRNSEGFVKD